MNNKLKIPKILLPALRQYQHNNNKAFLTAFDFNETIRIVILLEKSLKEHSKLSNK